MDARPIDSDSAHGAEASTMIGGSRLTARRRAAPRPARPPPVHAGRRHAAVAEHQPGRPKRTARRAAQALADVLHDDAARSGGAAQPLGSSATGSASTRCTPAAALAVGGDEKAGVPNSMAWGVHRPHACKQLIALFMDDDAIEMGQEISARGASGTFAERSKSLIGKPEVKVCAVDIDLRIRKIQPPVQRRNSCDVVGMGVGWNQAPARRSHRCRRQRDFRPDDPTCRSVSSNSYRSRTASIYSPFSGRGCSVGL